MALQIVANSLFFHLVRPKWEASEKGRETTTATTTATTTTTTATMKEKKRRSRGNSRFYCGTFTVGTARSDLLRPPSAMRRYARLLLVRNKKYNNNNNNNTIQKKKRKKRNSFHHLQRPASSDSNLHPSPLFAFCFFFF